MIKEANLPVPIREHKFLEDRKFRADFCWIEERLIVEVQGGIWQGGRHTSGHGYTADRERSNLAQLAGFIILEVTPDQIKNGKAIEWITQILKDLR